MYQILIKKTLKYRPLFVFGVISLFIFIITFVYKSNDKIIKNSQVISSFKQTPDFVTFKKFLLNQIKSPFINIDYEIKSGDTIQKILKKFKVENSEIQKVIYQYKKYSNPAQLLSGNKINITFKKNSLNKTTQ